MAEQVNYNSESSEGGFPKAETAIGQSAKVSKLSKLLGAALIAVSPYLSSCAVETDSESTPDDESAEVVQAQGKVQIAISTGNALHVKGEYPKDFELQVFVDGKMVKDEVVPAGGFNAQEAMTTFPKSVEIKAFKLDETGEQIKIGLNPGPEGMVGQSMMDLSSKY